MCPPEDKLEVPGGACLYCEEGFADLDTGVIIPAHLPAGMAFLSAHIECLMAHLHPSRRPDDSPFTRREWARQLFLITKFEGPPRQWPDLDA